MHILIIRQIWTTAMARAYNLCEIKSWRYFSWFFVSYNLYYLFIYYITRHNYKVHNYMPIKSLHTPSRLTPTELAETMNVHSLRSCISVYWPTSSIYTFLQSISNRSTLQTPPTNKLSIFISPSLLRYVTRVQ